MAKIFSALEIQYNRLDQSIRRYLAAKLGKQTENYSSSNVFGMIINIVKGICQNMFLYLEDAVQEQNIMTATRKNSIFSLAKLSGYEPFYGYAASGNISLNLLPNNQSGLSRVLIPNKTVVKHVESGTSYVVELPLDYYTVSLGNSFQTFSLHIVEGSYKNARWQARGYPLESFNVTNLLYYDINHVTVRVNGEVWERHACMYDMQPDTKGYVIEQAFDGQFSIVFGNDVHGVQLSSGNTVQCEYLTHTGQEGNLSVTAQKQFVFQTSLLDSQGNAVNGNELFLLTMSSPVTGGINSETINTVRHMIGYNSRALVLASENNYKLFLNRFSFIGYNNVWSESNSMIVNINALTNTFLLLSSPEQYYELSEDDFLLSEDQKQLIRQTLDNSRQTFAGSSINFVDPVLRNFAAFVYVKKNPEYDSDSVKADIETVIARHFINIKDDTMFISKSSLVKSILDGVSGIESLELTFISARNEEAYAAGYYTTVSQKYVNGTYLTRETVENYTGGSSLSLDMWNNIQLDSKLEFPVLLGGFRYYTDKESGNKDECVLVDAVNIYFV